MVILSLGLVRGAIAGVIGAGLTTALLAAIRSSLGLPPLGDFVSLMAGLVGVVAYLFGLGAFGYWIRWAVGAVDADDEHHDEPQHGTLDWKAYLSFHPNHKVIGLQYTVTALLIFVVAGLLALLMRLELSLPGFQVVTPDQYNTLVGLHGLIMLATILAGSAGIVNYALPLMIGARDMAFPRLNALSYWLWPPAAVLLLLVLTSGADAGWTVYPPLSTQLRLGGLTFFMLGFYLAGFSSILGGVNFVVTILKHRAPGMTLWNMPIFAWFTLAMSALSVTVTQFVATALLTVLLERALGMGFYNPAKGGNALLFQHLFWAYSHPAVYIFALPTWGIFTELLPVFARKPLFAYRTAAWAALSVAVIGSVVWGHHLYPAGMERPLYEPMIIATELVSVPTGLMFLAWLGTIWMGRLIFPTPALFVLGGIVFFLVGGLTGLPLASAALDLHLNDTNYVVAHFHHTLATFLFSFFAAIYFWFPKVTGRMYSERWGKVHFWLMTTGFFVLTTGLFRIGIQGMRRRVADYPPGIGWESWSILATVGAFMVGLAILVMIVNLVVSARRGARSAANPWESRSLEWSLVASPAPAETWLEPPQVVGDPYDYASPKAPAYGLPGRNGLKPEIAPVPVLKS
ncbi:MAG: cbb3-type cytochrome c oxidase subunit I [Chloroflexi bacterium]|nr:cbb3-type cytochrome c oxidase subunit I [Chloroflexota bacterium]